MSTFEPYSGLSVPDIVRIFKNINEGFDDYSGEHGQRRRFMAACNKLWYNDLQITQKVLKGNIPPEEFQALTEVMRLLLKLYG